MITNTKDLIYNIEAEENASSYFFFLLVNFAQNKSKLKLCRRVKSYARLCSLILKNKKIFQVIEKLNDIMHFSIDQHTKIDFFIN